MDNTSTSIEQAAAEAVRVVANAAEAAAKVIANAAAESVKVVNVQGSGDHDLLIELRTLMGVMQSTITEIKTGNQNQTTNHEQRISNVEKKVSNSSIATAIYTLATIAMISLMVGHMIVK